MRSATAFSSTALLLAVSSLVSAQTFTSCNPLDKTCPADPGLGTTLTTDFTSGASPDWTLADGTTMTYGSQGAEFVISSTQAPTMSSEKYIMFGKVSVTTKSSPGTGIVSSFILESDDLDEIDWEWLGSTDNSVESNFFGKGNTTTYNRAVYHAVADPIGTAHTYTIDWTAARIEWSIDGTVIRTLPYADPLALGGKNYPQTPMRTKMGSWVGCASAAAAADPATEGTCSWAGGPVDLSQGPFTMYVSSVTIEDYGCGGDYTYTDRSGSYQSISSSGTCGANSSDSSSASTSASSSPSTTGSETKSSTASSSTSGGGILVQTSSTLSTFTSGSTGTSKANGTADGSAASTKTTATSSSTSSTSTAIAANGADSVTSKSKYDVLNFAVIVLGLGLGYLVM